MAINTATLTVTITESLKLNGAAYGNTTIKSLASCGESIQKAVSVPHTTSIRMVVLDTVAKRDNFVYFRIKNADATNFITLHLEGAVTGTVQIKLLAGESYESTCNEIWDYTAAAWDKIYRINATSDTATCDVEFFYVSK